MSTRIEATGIGRSISIQAHFKVCVLLGVILRNNAQNPAIWYTYPTDCKWVSENTPFRILVE
jgi:hypothetical protein